MEHIRGAGTFTRLLADGKSKSADAAGQGKVQMKAGWQSPRTQQGESFSSMPVGIFQGYNSVNDGSGGGLSKALTGETEKSGGYSSVRYRVCSGIQELCEEMGISASVAASFGPVASANLKLDFVDSLKLTTHSTCIVVSAKHTVGTETATDWRLKSDVKPPTSNSELVNFFRLYGDSFLTSRTAGGEYFAVYTFYAESRERQSQLTAELHAKGLLSVVRVDASVQVKLSRVSSTKTTRVSLDQTISGMANPHFPSADGIIQYALDFPSLSLTSPVFIDLKTTGYERVPGIGTTFDGIVANRRRIAALQPKFVALKNLQNNITDISDVYSFYGGYAADTKLVRVKSEADTDAKAVRELVAAYMKDPTQALTPPSLRSLANGTPSLRYEFSKSQWYVSDQGTPFDHVDRRAFLQQKTRISAIQLGLLTYDDFKRVISYFRVTYTNQSRGSWVMEHGRGNPGHLTEELMLSPGRVGITAIRGNCVHRAGGPLDYWRSLGFDLSDGREVFYGYWPEGTKWVVPAGGFLLGFSGRFGSCLNELQNVYASFRPAAWNP